jgi:hypothetical protein
MKTNAYKRYAVSVVIKPDDTLGNKKVGARYVDHVSALSESSAEAIARLNAVKKGVPERRVSVKAVEYIASDVKMC